MCHVTLSMRQANMPAIQVKVRCMRGLLPFQRFEIAVARDTQNICFLLLQSPPCNAVDAAMVGDHATAKEV